MSGTDSPAQGSGNDTALSYEDGVAALEGFLSRVPDGIEDNDDQDSAAGDESQNAEGQNSEVDAKADTESQDAKSGEENDDDDLELDLDDSDTSKDAPDEPKFKAGQFASHDAKVKLEDGTTISVADLIAGNMFQSTFTKKTTALAEDRKAFDAERGEFAETKKQVEHQRNVILSLVNELMPKEPQSPTDPDDPLQEIEYQRELRIYQQKMGKLQTLWQQSQADQTKAAEKQKQEQEEAAKKQSEEYQAWAQKESEKFFEKYPKLKSEEELKKWANTVYSVAENYYGIPPEEVAMLADHRHLMILTDAAKWREAISKRDASAKQKTPQQPQQARIPQKQRMGNQTVQNRDFSVATDRLRKTGSYEDAIKALEKFV